MSSVDDLRLAQRSKDREATAARVAGDHAGLNNLTAWLAAHPEVDGHLARTTFIMSDDPALDVQSLLSAMTEVGALQFLTSSGAPSIRFVEVELGGEIKLQFQAELLNPVVIEAMAAT
jgi:hypothetical protein